MARLTGDEIEAAFRDGQLNRDWEKQDNADKQRWWVHGHAREMDHEMEHQAVVASDAANARVASLEAEIAGLWQVKAKPNESYFDATMRDPQMRRTYCEEAVIAERVARIDAERDALRARVVELESERDDWKELHAGAHQSWQGLMERVSEHDSRRRAAEIEARDAKGRVAELEAQLAGKGTGPLCAMCGHQDWQHHSDGYLAGGPVDWGRCRARTCNCEEYEAPSSSPAPEAVHATPHADSQVRSKSVLRREAVQRGEPVPGDGPGPTYLPGFQHPPAPPPEPKEVPGPVAIGINLPGEGKGEPGPVVPFERYPPPEGECERCGSRGFVWPVTVVPIDGPVGRIDLLCLDCAETPEPREVPGPSPADTNDAGTVLQAPEGPGGGETGPACTHGVTFDEAAARGLSVQEVRDHWPRHSGKCERCGYDGLYYASYMHYLSGDW
jgi:hypothetical protein